MFEFYHSGGPSNSSADADLGGSISNFEISGGLGNLFDSLGTLTYPMIDYRCFYVKAIEDCFDVSFYMRQAFYGSQVYLGVDYTATVQEISFSGVPNEGDSVDFSLLGNIFTVFYSADISAWAVNLNSAMTSVGFPCLVEASGEIPFVIMTIKMLAGKNFPVISVVANYLNDTIIDVNIISSGSPINTTAPIISSKLNAPPVAFGNPGPGSVVSVGNMVAGDYFPVWVKRWTPAGIRKVILDDFGIIVRGANA